MGNPIKNTKKVSGDGLKVFAGDYITLPALPASIFAEKENSLDTLSLESLSKNSATAISIAGLGQEMTNYPGLFDNRDTEAFLTHDKTTIRTQYPDTKGKKGTLSKRRARSVTRKALGLNGMVQICLPHSGFWITLDPIPRVNKFVLAQQLAENELQLSSSTATMIYASPRVLYIRILMEFISEFIVDTTLQLPEGDNIMDYINVLDIDVLVLEIVKSYYSEGFDIALSCEQVVGLSEDGKDTKCNYSITGKVDLNEVYRFDKNGLSEEQLAILAKRTSGSVSLDDIDKYKDEYSLNGSEDEVHIELGDKSYIDLTLGSASISEYLDVSSTYTNALEVLLDKVMMGNEDPVLRKAKLESIATDLVLVKYCHFVKKINVNGSKTSDLDTIYDTLNTIMDDSKCVDRVMTALVKYVDKNLIAMTCTPVYTCPKCRKDNIPDTSKTAFGSMIPLDVLEVFTALRSKSEWERK